jgi:hypothetical protein
MITLLLAIPVIFFLILGCMAILIGLINFLEWIEKWRKK